MYVVVFCAHKLRPGSNTHNIEMPETRVQSLGLQDCGEWAYSNKRSVNPSTACVICPREPTVAWKGATFAPNSTRRASTRDDGAAASSAGYGTG